MSLQKNGANDPVVGQILQFGPFPFKYQQKGCLKGGKPTLTKFTL
jgi:hypothetical protein